MSDLHLIYTIVSVVLCGYMSTAWSVQGALNNFIKLCFTATTILGLLILVGELKDKGVL